MKLPPGNLFHKVLLYPNHAPLDPSSCFVHFTDIIAQTSST